MTLNACTVLRNLFVEPVAAQFVEAGGRLGYANDNVARCLETHNASTW